MVRKAYSVTTRGDSWEQLQRPYSGETQSRRNVMAGNSFDKGKRQLWLLFVPLLDVTILNLSLILCYIIGSHRNHTNPPPRVPFISELGSTPPQSYIFTFGMTATSFTSIPYCIFSLQASFVQP